MSDDELMSEELGVDVRELRSVTKAGVVGTVDGEVCLVGAALRSSSSSSSSSASSSAASSVPLSVGSLYSRRFWSGR